MVYLSTKREREKISRFYQEAQVENSSDLFLTALICDSSGESPLFYVIGEDRQLMNDKNRTQFVGQFRVEKQFKYENVNTF